LKRNAPPEKVKKRKKDMTVEKEGKKPGGGGPEPRHEKNQLWGVGGKRQRKKKGERITRKK